MTQKNKNNAADFIIYIVVASEIMNIIKNIFIIINLAII